MKKGLSLHIGLNVIDPAAYGDNGQLENCVNDARAMAEIASASGFAATSLHDAQATSTRVTSEIVKAASQLTSGDYFLVTYAGHGSQVPDEDNLETDGMNETWCLYDRQLIDNELFCLWKKFAGGVKIFVLSDSCHSGTMMRHFLLQVKSDLQALPPLSRRPAGRPSLYKRTVPLTTGEVIDRVRQVAVSASALKTGVRALDGVKNRALPATSSMINYLEHRDLYRNLILLAGEKRSAEIAAGLIYISGCQDNQLSGDGPGANGRFTGTLIRVWNKGAFVGAYPNFHQKILDQMPADQTPNYLRLGAVTPAYEAEKPFTMQSAVTPSATVPAAPSISLPASWNRHDGVPVLKINKGTNPYYYVELSTDKELFNRAENEALRNASNFYATYRDPAVGRRTEPEFSVPDYVWNKLKEADTLYYRIGTTSSLTAWDNFQVSFGDSKWDTAPGMQLLTEAPAPTEPAPTPSGGGDTGVRITAPVGPGQPNRQDDVKRVQALLNKVPNDEGGPAQPLKTDGRFGPLTGNAIKKFQEFWSLDSDASEYRFVKPGSSTLQELNSYASRAAETPAPPPLTDGAKV